MQNLSNLEKNMFDDEEHISMPKFFKLSSDHVDRLVSTNPGGVLDPEIAATQAVFNQFNIVYSSKTIEEALKKGATIGLGKKVDTVLEAARKLEKRVSLLYDTGSETYTEFFPQGLTELNNAGKGEWPIILARLKAATAAHTTDLGGTVAADWAGYLTSYQTTKSGQAGKKGKVDDLRSLVLLDRKAVARQMFINLHTILVRFIDKPGCVATYFDESLVNSKQNSDTDHAGLIRVRVTNFAGEPLINADVAIYDQQGQLVGKGNTNDDGIYKSLSLPLGFYDVTVAQLGYVTRTHQYQVFDNNDPLHEIQLTSV